MIKIENNILKELLIFVDNTKRFESDKYLICERIASYCYVLILGFGENLWPELSISLTGKGIATG